MGWRAASPHLPSGVPEASRGEGQIPGEASGSLECKSPSSSPGLAMAAPQGPGSALRPQALHWESGEAVCFHGGVI